MVANIDWYWLLNCFWTEIANILWFTKMWKWWFGNRVRHGSPLARHTFRTSRRRSRINGIEQRRHSRPGNSKQLCYAASAHTQLWGFSCLISTLGRCIPWNRGERGRFLAFAIETKTPWHISFGILYTVHGRSIVGGRAYKGRMIFSANIANMLVKLDRVRSIITTVTSIQVRLSIWPNVTYTRRGCFSTSWRCKIFTWRWSDQDKHI